jgi:hypothetical protein
VTPLLVKVFVEIAQKAVKAGKSLADLPTSIPEMMLEYLRHLNPKDPTTPGHVPDNQVILASRVLGRLSLEEHYVPREFRSDEARSRLEARGFKAEEASSALRRLIQNGALDERQPGGTSILRFSLDPVAEFLAAIDWVDFLGSSWPHWEAWLKELQATPRFPDDLEGFLGAVQGCILAYREDFDIPDQVFQWLAKVPRARSTAA